MKLTLHSVGTKNPSITLLTRGFLIGAIVLSILPRYSCPPPRGSCYLEYPESRRLLRQFPKGCVMAKLGWVLVLRQWPNLWIPNVLERKLVEHPIHRLWQRRWLFR
jgi:hypothetical protein